MFLTLSMIKTSYCGLRICRGMGDSDLHFVCISVSGRVPVF